MSKQYLNLFPSDELKEAMSSFPKKPLIKSHSKGFTPMDDIILKAGKTYELVGWSGTTKAGNPSVSITIDDWQPYTGAGSSSTASDDFEE